jgi:hypothetical protein
MSARECHLTHDCSAETWHVHNFADKSGSIRWSTDELHLAIRLIHDALIDPVIPSETAPTSATHAPPDDPDAFSALNSREPDPELW